MVRAGWVLSLALCSSAVATATLPELPQAAAQPVPLRSCSLKQMLGLPTPTPYYDHLYQWRKGNELLALEFKRENTVDAYANLLLRYKGGQLVFVHQYDWGEAGQAGRQWTLQSGKVVSAKAYSSVMGKHFQHPLPPGSMPQIYLEKPTAQWFSKVACKPLQ